MTEINIASAQDLKGINQLRTAISNDPCSIYKPSWDLSHEDILESKNRITFVSKNKTQIIGYLIVHSNSPFNDSDNDAEVEVLGVHPDHRGQKEATKLLKYAYQYTGDKTNLNHLKLRVSKDNPKAKKLFEKEGFSTCCSGAKGEWMVKDIKR